MSATTVNAFPPLHAFNYSRSWFLAFIVLLHVGFFWGLTHGVTIGSVKLAPPVIVVDVPVKPLQPPKRLQPVEPTIDRPWVPPIEQPVLRHDDDSTAPRDTTQDPPPPRREVITEKPGAGPEIVLPRLDARYPFSEPVYPSSEIRQEHEGTVVLRLQILADGRVGEVQIEASSGFPKLDESAAREARRWRMKPGTQNGVAAAMWATVPISFQLRN